MRKETARGPVRSGNVGADRTIIGDWYPHPIPDSVEWGDSFYCETSQVFRFLRSRRRPAVRFGDFVSCYSGCSFSIGENGFAEVGNYTLLNGALVMAEEHITIGSYCLVSWNVGIADSDFHPMDPALRRLDAIAISPYTNRKRPSIGTRPVLIGDNVWIGMGAIVLKGVQIGNNSVVGAGAVVSRNVPSNTVVAGNPARIVKRL